MHVCTSLLDHGELEDLQLIMLVWAQCWVGLDTPPRNPVWTGILLRRCLEEKTTNRNNQKNSYWCLSFFGMFTRMLYQISLAVCLCVRVFVHVFWLFIDQPPQGFSCCTHFHMQGVVFVSLQLHIDNAIHPREHTCSCMNLLITLYTIDSIHSYS